MDFTREPIVQTVITPKEGYKIVVRSSKNSGQEEYFVDAVEVVSFGTAIFFRSLERPKSFLVPASDYEVLEVREARMVLKNVGVDRAIKIGGGREAAVRGGRDHTHEKQEQHVEPEADSSEEAKSDSKTDTRIDKKRDRRRNSRRRRGRDEGTAKEGDEEVESAEGSARVELPKPTVAEGASNEPVSLTAVLTSLLPPPPTLISETIARYRDNASFKSAFFAREEDKEETAAASEPQLEDTDSEETELPSISLQQPEFGSFEMTEDEEEEIYQKRHISHEDEQAPHEDEKDEEEESHHQTHVAEESHSLEESHLEEPKQE